MATARRRADRPAAARPATPAAHADGQGRLKIGYRITADRIQGKVECAYRTDWTQLTTTILLWGGRNDDLSRRVLTNALRAALDERVRIHAFAAAARDLFRHTAQTLAREGPARRASYGRPGRDGQPLIPGPLHDDLLAAGRDLRNDARLRPRVTGAGGSLQEALSALRGVFESIGDCLEQVLQPLTLPANRDHIRAFLLETRREVDELAACHAAANGYVETLTVTEPGHRAVNLEVQGSFGGAPRRSARSSRLECTSKHTGGSCCDRLFC